MIVLDASIVVELLINGPLADAIREELASTTEAFLVPHLIDIEALSAFRRLTNRRADPHRAVQFVSALAALPAERCSHLPLLDRIWELRHNFTAYDATYIALAEATGSAIYTCDEKLLHGHHAKVLVFTQRS